MPTRSRASSSPSEVEYRAFDSEGRKLEVLVDRKVIRRRWLRDASYEYVVVRAVEDDPTHADELAELLVATLGRRGQRSPSMPLAALVAAAIEHGDLYE